MKLHNVTRVMFLVGTLLFTLPTGDAVFAQLSIHDLGALGGLRSLAGDIN